MSGAGVVSERIVRVEYNEPDRRSRGERKSKLLKVDSELYRFLMELKEFLKSRGLDHSDRMALHSEVLNDDRETEADFISRVAKFEGKQIDIYNISNYGIVGGAIAIIYGRIPEYRFPIKSTIAYFGNDTIKLNRALEEIAHFIEIKKSSDRK
jgi:hypothetical protein